MDWMTPVYVIVALLLVLLNGFFVLAEFALVKVRATRIEELARKGNRQAAVARQMVGRLDNYLAATQLGITVASLGLGWVGEPAFSEIVEAAVGKPGWWTPHVSHVISAVTAFIIITFLHILFGELAPKSLAIRRPERSALLIAYPMRWAYRVFYVPMFVLNGASNWILKRMGLEAAHGEVAHTEQELRMLLAAADTTAGLSLPRLLMVGNVFDLGHQTVRDAMIPWSHVKWLPRSAGRDDVMRHLAEHRFSRWPVLDRHGVPAGYLMTRDLIGTAADDGDWTSLIRPLRTVRPTDTLEATMQLLQQEGTNMAVVMDRGRPVGLITLEDILEEIVGRIEDEYPRLPRLSLREAFAAGGVVLDLAAGTPEEAVRALLAAIPPGTLPPRADLLGAVLDRERQMSTDVGNGVAIPHARCRGLARPLVVFGLAVEPIVFDARSAEPVRLIFLLITPAERPNLQVFFLAEIANLAQNDFLRERLCRVESPQELFDVIAAAERAATG